MSLSLVTGYAGKPHVKSSQDGAFNAAVYGNGKYVFDIGNQFAYEIISNNIIRVKDGYALNQGRFMGMETRDYEDVVIDNGLQGVKRADLISMRYTLNPDTGIETAELVVIKGTSGDVYFDPESVKGNILNGASEDDFLLYRVKIDGINIAAVEPLFTESSSVMMMIKAVENKMGKADISTIGNGTITGAISALNNNLSNFIKNNYISLPTTTIEPNSFRAVEYNFSVPDGYKLLNSSIGHSGNSEIYPFGVQWNKDIGDITIYYYFKNTYPYEQTVSPFVIITLVKNM